MTGGVGSDGSGGGVGGWCVCVCVSVCVWRGGTGGGYWE